MESLLRKLLTDSEFMELNVTNALDIVKYYDYTHSYDRWNQMMETKE
jgi:hypothetical protein